MADASDSKSDVGDYVWVQVPSPAFVYGGRRITAETVVWRFFVDERNREEKSVRGVPCNPGSDSL